MSLAVLLMMSVALVAGESDARDQAVANASGGLSTVMLTQHFQRSFDHQLGQRALSLGIGLAVDLSPFRGEDE